MEQARSLSHCCSLSILFVFLKELTLFDSVAGPGAAPSSIPIAEAKAEAEADVWLLTTLKLTQPTLTPTPIWGQVAPTCGTALRGTESVVSLS